MEIGSQIAITWAWLSASFVLQASPSESDYQKDWCKGELEVVLNDRTRVDCLTDTHAIEVDFAKKWYEAIGQSLHYGFMTNRTPGIGLIVLTEVDQMKAKRLLKVIEVYNLPIKVWFIHKIEEKRWIYLILEAKCYS